ncbi:hypothetical protein GCM10012285_47810 [Streptomyces kronopolitis]|uniref:Uncharacterized protein n=1 Tax=Streptomyces kronopolitis TaxID=1612435 RepID=A0ABQ2JVG4_9ACTN|nr:hypothetical protein GCM10012285_47810 [Streptomyces kronopolitis]
MRWLAVGSGSVVVALFVLRMVLHQVQAFCEDAAVAVRAWRELVRVVSERRP